MTLPPVVEALALREWALAVVRGGSPSVPRASEQAWRLFGWAERCALPLRQRLRHVPEPLKETLDLELQRVLSLQSLLHRVDRILGTFGAIGIPLKGSVPLLRGGEPLDVVDLDLLVSPELVSPLAKALEDEGLNAGRDAAIDLPVGAPGGHERAVRGSDGILQVELHVAIPLLADRDPFEGTRATCYDHLRVLAPDLHLWHVLTHGMLHHPERRGAIRELLLLRDALSACTPDERASALRMVASHPLQERLAAVLDAATADSEDPFAAEAALRLTLGTRYRDTFAQRRIRWLSTAAYALLAGRGEYGRLWWGGAVSAWGEGEGSSVRSFDALRPARFAWRGALLALATPPAWSAARTARHLSAAHR
jgi:hypothetical protein